MSATVFISYSSKDQDIAETICRALEARGLACWIACRDVHAGDNFQESIVRALRAARVMVLVFTSNANNSDEIKKELVLAGRHQVTVVPVRVEDVAPNDAFTYEFATRQWVDLFKDWEHEVELLATRISHVLDSAKPTAVGAETAAPAAIVRAPATKTASRQPLIWVAVLAAIVVIGGVVFYLRGTPQSAQPPQVAMQTPPAAVPPAPSVPAPMTAPIPPPVSPPPATQSAPPAAASPPVQTPEPPPPPVTETAAAPPQPDPPAVSPDEAAWTSASNAATRATIGDYLKQFPHGAHVQEAQLRLSDLIRNDPTPSKNFDGAWQTTWTCSNLGQYPGYTYQFVAEIKNGVYHGLKGVKGEPSSLIMDGKIEADGTAGFFGEIVVGSSLVGLGVARGTPSDFHAMAKFESTTGSGKRIEGRPCSLTFTKQ
ncbi:MAG TPA: toll/interleukin-1 receptor domain-containing protein [Xanthobacteraceae bacterium]|nr:toll/interleukin-1 receptor domain-containing protein [Xanthobacteraceae bacterium]